MIIVAASGGIIGALGAVYLMFSIWFTAYTYAKNLLIQSDIYRESHPRMSAQLRFFARLYMCVCYIFIASLITGGFTAAFFIIHALISS
ncbi:MAG: hypothetical protein IJR63_00840 [Synergistaceae bacterium]|nr:hypothetical protein [Synergistaceae bacterium]